MSGWDVRRHMRVMQAGGESAPHRSKARAQTKGMGRGLAWEAGTSRHGRCAVGVPLREEGGQSGRRSCHPI